MQPESGLPAARGEYCSPSHRPDSAGYSQWPSVQSLSPPTEVPAPATVASPQSSVASPPGDCSRPAAASPPHMADWQGQGQGEDKTGHCREAATGVHSLSSLLGRSLTAATVTRRRTTKMDNFKPAGRERRAEAVRPYLTSPLNRASVELTFG